MAIAYRSIASTSYASRTNTTISAPASIADDDILIAALFVGKNDYAPPVTPPAGWNTLLRSPSNMTDLTFHGQLNLYWKRAASESGSYVFTHATGSTQGGIVAISGVPNTGTPIFTYSVNSAAIFTGTTSQTTALGVTTGAANDLLLYIAHDWTGSGSLSPPTGFTERLDSLLYIADKIQTSSGATGDFTQTNGNGGAGLWAAWLLNISSVTVTDPTVTDIFTPSTALGSDDNNADSAFRVVSTLTTASNGTLRVLFTAGVGNFRSLQINEASFGKWDSAAGDGSTTATPIRLTFSGANSVVVAQGQTAFSDIVAHPGFSLAAGDKVVVCYGTGSPDSSQRYSLGNTNAFTWYKGSVSGAYLNFQAAFGTSQGAVRVGGGSAFYDYALAKVTTFATAGGGITVSPTGVAATGSVGQVGVSAKANVSVTGVSGTGAVGQATVGVVASTTVTGVAATGSVGQVTVSAKANVNATGVAATGAVGQVSVVGKAVVSATGVAAQGNVGQLTVASGATLNPADKKNGLLTLSNGNLTATSTDSGGNNWVRSTTAQTGKRYVEFKVDTYAASHVFGISDLSAITYVGADAHSFGLYGNGYAGINGTFPDWGGGAGTPYNTFTTGDTVCMAVDLTAKKVWWKINGSGWNGGFGDPVAGTGGNDISAYTGTPHYIIVSGGLNFVSTVNFGATAFTYTPPSGYSSWNGVTSVTTTLTGVAATGAVGQATVTAKQFVTVIPTGVAAAGAVGQVGVSAGLKVTPTGVAATGAVGQATVSVGTGITASATGVFATGFVGQVTVTAKQYVSITAAGVQGTGFVGQVSVSLPIGGMKGAKVWNGSAFVEKPVKVWSGSAWVQKPVKHWNGSAWV